MRSIRQKKRPADYVYWCREQLKHLSTVPTGQWGNIDNANGATIVSFPIAFKNAPFIVNCAEHSAMGWNTEVAICGADASRATNTQVAIYSKWVTAAGVIQRGENVEWFAVGI